MNSICIHFTMYGNEKKCARWNISRISNMRWKAFQLFWVDSANQKKNLHLHFAQGHCQKRLFSPNIANKFIRHIDDKLLRNSGWLCILYVSLMPMLQCFFYSQQISVMEVKAYWNSFLLHTPIPKGKWLHRWSRIYVLQRLLLVVLTENSLFLGPARRYVESTTTR